MYTYIDEGYKMVIACVYVYIQRLPEIQEMSKSLQTTHIYFYYFNHLKSGVGMWNAKCVSKYLGRFKQSRFEISNFRMFPQKTNK